MAASSAKDRAHVADGTFNEEETCALISARLDGLEAAADKVDAALARLEQLTRSGATMEESFDQLEADGTGERV